MKTARHFFFRKFFPGALCALALAGCGNNGNDTPVAAMNSFFDLVKKQQYNAAYDSTSLAFQGVQTEIAFEACARDLKLDDFSSCTWTVDSVAGTEARLTGDYVTNAQQKVQLQAVVIKASKGWILYALRRPSPTAPGQWQDLFYRAPTTLNLFNEFFTRKLPEENEVRGLISETIQKFNECLHKKEFRPFYDYVAVAWQAKALPEQVDRSFKPFIDQGILLDFITPDIKAIINEKPRLNSEGYLVVDGYYPTTPDRVSFHLKYIYELPKWKLMGITLNVSPVNPPPATTTVNPPAQ